MQPLLAAALLATAMLSAAVDAAVCVPIAVATDTEPKHAAFASAPGHRAIARAAFTPCGNV